MANVIAEVVKELINATWVLIRLLICLSIDALCLAFIIVAFVPPWRWGMIPHILKGERPGIWFRPLNEMRDAVLNDFCVLDAHGVGSFRARAIEAFTLTTWSCIVIPFAYLYV
mmetsp:Transcript_82740/g.233862  ORF Transcript_82740/g.233862 Transcript_82740/m.233862 type:complete len:113 (-) Transcript_82740:880-1218(-)